MASLSMSLSFSVPSTILPFFTNSVLETGISSVFDGNLFVKNPFILSLFAYAIRNLVW